MHQILIVDPWRDSVLSLSKDLVGSDDIRTFRVKNEAEARKVFEHIELAATVWFCPEVSEISKIKRLQEKTINLLVCPSSMYDKAQMVAKDCDAILKAPINITELKKTLSQMKSIEEAKAEGSKSYVDLFERSNDAILLVEPEEEKILEMNLKAESLLGLTKDEIFKKFNNWFEIATSDMQKEFRTFFRRSKRSYYARTFECKFNTEINKSRTEEDNAIVPANISFGEVKMGIINFKSKDVMEIIIRDITDKKISEIKLQKTMDNLKEANQKLEALSITDALTKISNRRHFENTLDIEFSKSSRHNIPISMIYMDIDNFKHYNDTNGHAAGDELLFEFAQTVKSVCQRNYTLVARLGGEEFVILLPCINKEGANVLATKVHEAINKKEFKHGEKQPQGKVTASIGVAEFPSDCKIKEDLIKMSDEAMYYSKTHGKNKITLHPLPADANKLKSA